MSEAEIHDRLLSQIARIRAFESHLLELFSAGELNGTTHTCIGQEMCAASLYDHLDPSRDAAFSNHRCHGHFIAYGGPVKGLMAEIMGREGGVCRGRGGSQHLCWEQFFSTGIQGSGVPMAAGYAWAAKQRGDRGMVVSHIGDGTLGQGVIYEALNLASLHGLPLLVMLEHNGWAQSTDTRNTIAGDYLKRFEGFGIEVDRRPADDPVALWKHLGEVVEHVRSGQPFVQVLDTFRLMAHSKGDDNRDPELVKLGWANDWFDKAMHAEATAARDVAHNALFEMEAISTNLQAAELQQESAPRAFAPLRGEPVSSVQENETGLRMNECIGLALSDLLKEDERVVVLGEDIADPYGGAFKVTRGLSDAFPGRVISTPISEAGIVGMANGMALNGVRPVVEIMFGDFVALAADQLVNQAAKMFYMYAEQVRVPLTVRLVSGGYRGYGATHSQSLEAWLCGVPGLEVVAVSRRHDVDALYRRVIQDDDNPTVVVENKTMYAQRPLSDPPTGFTQLPSSSERGAYPPLAYSCAEGRADVTVVTYGGLTDTVEAAMEELILEEEVDFDYFVLTGLYPLEIEPIVESVVESGRLLVVEEGAGSFGVGAAVISAVSDALGGEAFVSQRVCSADTAIPSARQLESTMLPSEDSVTTALLDVLEH